MLGIPPPPGSDSSDGSGSDGSGIDVIDLTRDAEMSDPSAEAEEISTTVQADERTNRWFVAELARGKHSTLTEDDVIRHYSNMVPHNQASTYVGQSIKTDTLKECLNTAFRAGPIPRAPPVDATITTFNRLAYEVFSKHVDVGCAHTIVGHKHSYKFSFDSSRCDHEPVLIFNFIPFTHDAQLVIHYGVGRNDLDFVKKLEINGTVTFPVGNETFYRYEEVLALLLDDATTRTFTATISVDFSASSNEVLP